MVTALLLCAALQVSYRLPYEDGKTYPLTQGNKGSLSHTGYCEYAFDFGMAEGTKVCAARDGKVIFAGDDEMRSGANGKYGSSGNHIKVDHGDGTIGQYFHLKYKGALVEVGDVVLQGDLIGLSGATGNVTGPHLHFQVDKGGKSIPVRFDDVEGDGVPKDGKSYPSKNTPGIPAATKEKLGALANAARTAEKEGAWGLAWQAWKRFADEKLKVKYAPQEEARARLDDIVRRGEEASKATDPVALYRAKLAWQGAPAKGFDGVARPGTELLEPYYQGLKAELEGRLAAARNAYRTVLDGKPDPELRRRAEERMAVVVERMRELTRKQGP